MKHSPPVRKFSGAATLLLLLVAAWAGAAVASAQEEETTTPAPAADAARAPEHGAEAKPERKKGRSVLRGRVLYADTKQPVRLAGVTLVRLDSILREEPQREEGAREEQPAEAESPFKKVMTGRRGEFEVGGLAAGRYAVNVFAPGVVAAGNLLGPSVASLGRRDFDERVVELDGVNAAEKDILVTRGGALSGRVTYADAEPATNATVQLHCRRAGAWSRCGVGGVKTDDRGLYRFEALPTGEYAVSASENNAGGNDQQQYGNHPTALTGAYHPAAKTLEHAVGVRVEAGGEAEGVDIRFGDEVMRRVAGVIRWRHDNRAVHHATVRLQKVEPAGGGRGGASPPAVTFGGALVRSPYAAYAIYNFGQAVEHMTVWSNEEGRWAFGDVPEGTYLVSVTAYLERKAAPHASGEISMTSQSMPLTVQKFREVTVGGGDVTDVQFLLTEGGSISGTVTIEGAARPTALSSVYVTATLGGPQQVYAIPQTVRPDGGFVIGGLPPGEVTVDLYLGQQASGLYLKSMTAPDGTDLTRSPARVVEDGEIGGVRVVLGSDGATLAGRVRLAAGGTPFGTTLLLAPADQSRWGVRSRLFTANASADGNFRIICPPGDYLLIAWHGWEEGYASPDEFISSRIARAQRVTLAPGERKSVEVVVAEDEK